MAKLAVFAEIDEGAIHDISLQCLTKAHELAGADGRVAAMALGSGAADAAARLPGYGADEVWVADGPQSGYVSGPCRRLVAGWIREHRPEAMLFPATTVGLDLAASVAGELKAPCVLYADDIRLGPDGWRVRRVEFDRKVSTWFAPARDGTLLVALRDGSAESSAWQEGRTGTVHPLTWADDRPAGRVVRRDVAKKTVNLKSARVIVAGGAGVGSAENFRLIRELASALSAEIGATRAAVDAGWIPADHQIGQTGATVKPDVYIACGISGAVQHRVGMMDSGKIIAINTDPNAPIFRIAHYRIVGDLKVVIPKLLTLLRERGA